MKYLLILSAAATVTLAAFSGDTHRKPERIFDGKSFKGWEGDTLKTWRIEQGALVGGSLQTKVPNNDFLCTKRSYSDFVLKAKFKLVGTEGFINSGVQFRSKRLTNPSYEMEGYQADLGDKYWGSLYDESRRNKTLAGKPAEEVAKLLKPNDWNDYEIRADKRHIVLKINGVTTVDYTEPDTNIPQSGLIGLQIHGGGKALVYFKDIFIEELK
ncbi:hypothetical protein FHS57_005229 [Runella defluvii]|uniref:3-keto-alpha-glucoside-1,2-lyase/3-keto-2-hydroxy-glucal hydratase domain-containing protein n=1 Tax=Runella defluvii TaxID=370973 RepID=A0A7W5ZQF4_9BACT|nr:DUF1080 domain-containing protein [Runella defluvii]MBB3841208.1 hypothetical protein [Runella defluvii]